MANRGGSTEAFEAYPIAYLSLANRSVGLTSKGLSGRDQGLS